MLMSAMGKSNDVSILWEEFVRCIFHVESDILSTSGAVGNIAVNRDAVAPIELEPTVYVLEVEMPAASKWVIKAKAAADDIGASAEVHPLMTTMDELQTEIAKQVSVPLELQRWLLDGKEIPLSDKASVVALAFARA